MSQNLGTFFDDFSVSNLLDPLCVDWDGWEVEWKGKREAREKLSLSLGNSTKAAEGIKTESEEKSPSLRLTSIGSKSL